MKVLYQWFGFVAHNLVIKDYAKGEIYLWGKSSSILNMLSFCRYSSLVIPFYQIGCSPVRSSYMVKPQAHMSAGLPYKCRIPCSGEEYKRVPQLTSDWFLKFADTLSARPKSINHAVSILESFKSKMLPGLISQWIMSF